MRSLSANGQIAIDWSREDPLISLQIHDESGDVLIRQKLPLSTLDPGFLTRTKAPGKLVQLDDGTALTGEEIKSSNRTSPLRARPAAMGSA